MKTAMETAVTAMTMMTWHIFCYLLFSEIKERKTKLK